MYSKFLGAERDGRQGAQILGDDLNRICQRYSGSNEQQEGPKGELH